MNSDFGRISFTPHSYHYRFHAVLLRDRFDQKKDIVDMRVARQLLIDGERELFEKQHPQPMICMSIVTHF